jgi:hypothetical protein
MLYDVGHADCFQKRELWQMTLRSVIDWALTIFTVTLISIAAALETDFLVVEHTTSFKTPGMFVMNQIDSYNKRLLILILIDFIWYLAVICCLIALFKWRSRRSLGVDSFQKRELQQVSVLSVTDVIKAILCMIAGVVFALVSTWETEGFAVNHAPEIKTPGKFVMDQMLTEFGPTKLKLGHRVLILFGVDFILYFAVIWSLLALLRWRLRKNR